MSDQVIVCIGREFGSGGHVIGEMMAKELGIPLYDKELLHKMAEEKDLDVELLKRYDENVHKPFTSRTVRGFTNAPEALLADVEASYLKEMADRGESFLIVGRRAESVLRGYSNTVSIFITGDWDARVQRIMNRDEISEREAEKLINEMDRRRKAYHNYYSEGKWGDSRNYDITVNSTRLGLEGTAAFLVDYVKRRVS